MLRPDINRTNFSIMNTNIAKSNLIELAKSPSKEDRAFLISKLVDEFISNEITWSEREALLFDEALRSLALQASTVSKARLAQSVADCSRGLGGLHRELANDEPEVASPILARSEILDDAFLVSIAQSKGDEHRIAIGARREIGETLAETLVELGDIQVKRQVAGNSGARLSRRAFSILSEIAVADDGVRDAVCDRTDLPKETIERLMTLLPPEGQGRLQALLEHGPDHALRIVGEARAKIEAELPDRRRRRMELMLRVKEIQESDPKRAAFITELANDDKVLDLALVLSQLTGLPEQAACNALLGISAEPVACICRLLSLDQNGVIAIARLRERRLRLPESMRVHTVKLWQVTDEATSRRVLNIARVRANHIREAEGIGGTP